MNRVKNISDFADKMLVIILVFIKETVPSLLLIKPF